MPDNDISATEGYNVLAKPAGVVVSAHFMQRQNESDAALYDAKTLAKESLFISPLEVKNTLIPLLKNASEEVIEKRSKTAVERAKRNFQYYDLPSSQQVGTAEYITEALFDDWFRKGTIGKSDRLHFRDRIQTLLDRDKPIEMAVPMLPRKMPCPLKTRGKLPCMAEAGLLARLGEIAGIVNKLYHDGRPDTAHKQMAKFIVMGDGRRYMHSSNAPAAVIESYQRALKWWVKQLDLDRSVSITDFEHVLEQALTSKQKEERQKYQQNTLAVMNKEIGGLLNPMDMEGSLNKAIALEPYQDERWPEGRFVPLFKSIIYNIHYKILSRITDTQLLGENEYATMYRDLTRHLFTPYTDNISNDTIKEIEHVLNGEVTHRPPAVPAIKEYVRREMLKEAWQATIAYLAVTIADRSLAEDPVIQALPDAIRWSIHSKPGQIALAADSTGDAVQAWHGASILRPSGAKIKFSNESALHAEGHGAKPVMVRYKDGDPKSADPDDVLEKFVDSQQPLFYVHPDIQFYDTSALQQRFTRTK